MTTKLEEQINVALKLLPRDKPKRFIVRPTRPKGGKKRHGGGATCHCGATMGQCPECGKQYRHGTAANCTTPSCRAMNAPIDCAGCGMVVSRDLKGVLDYDMNLRPWRRGGGKKRSGGKMGFAKLEKTLAKRPDVRNPGGLARWIGVKKLGKRKFQKRAIAGRKRAARR